MNLKTITVLSVCCHLALFASPSQSSAADEVLHGEPLDPSQYGPAIIEDMSAVLERERAFGEELAGNPKARNGRPGRWMIPPLGAMRSPESGNRYVTNEWGDTRMGIGFPGPVDVHGARVGGQAGPGVWTTGLRVVGYRDGKEVGRTEWFRAIGETPQWFAMALLGVDRIVFESEPVVNGGGWYSLDDLTYTPAAEGSAPAARVVLTFDDVEYGRKLAELGYGGLTWEAGTGDFDAATDAIPAPRTLRDPDEPTEAPEEPAGSTRGGLGTLPVLGLNFQGVIRGDAGSNSYPPDSCGAIGPDHFVEVVNRVFAVYLKSNGARIVNVNLGTFMPGASGDPRVVFDQHSGRWIVIASNFSNRVFLAVSATSDPTGPFFKTSVLVSDGSDANCWPDYPTLGVDANGIYSAAYMVGCGMSIFAMDKAPLIAPAQSLGTVTAFRGQSFEGAIQPVHTYGTPPGEYLISRIGTTSLRLRRIDGPLTSPTLTLLGSISIPTHSFPPDVPALGSTTPLDSVDHRLMNAVYRDGSIWTAHTVAVNTRAACRWYQVDAATRTLIQSGTVSDSSLHYFFPGIAVNIRGDVGMGFSGSNANQYAACYYTGRLVNDPPGEMATPALLRPGAAPHNLIDGFGRNRWGDYSLTTLDPADEATVWTIQEYAHANNVWGTWVAQLILFRDCNGNEVNDVEDVSGGGSPDCNGNFTPDECEPDCNANGVADECDLTSGTSTDCGINGVPDECETDCDVNGIPDDCDVLAGAPDCNNNLLPDTCEADCDASGIADACELNEVFSVPEVQLSPFHANSPQSLTIPGPPEAGGAVSLTLAARGDFSGTDEFVSVDINGVPVGTVFVNDMTDCVEPSIPIVLDVPAETFNNAVNGGDAVIHLVPSPFVGINCPGATYIKVAVDYLLPSRDCDGNGTLDSCDIAQGLAADCNANGVPDSCDIASGTSLDADGNQIPDECACETCPGDVDGDGQVDGDDVQAFLACFIAGDAGDPDCACADLDQSGTFASADLAAFADALLGAADADPACP